MTQITGLPTFDPVTGQYDFGSAPQLKVTGYRPPPPELPSILGGGIRAGFNTAQGLLGSTAAAIGHATGFEGLAEAGQRSADKNFAEAAQFGRPDLEGAFFDEGDSTLRFLKKLGYQTAKQVPTIAGIIGTGAVTAAAAAPLGVTSAAGLTLASATGALTAGSALQAGENFSSAVESGQEITPEVAQRALALGIPAGAAEALVPFGLTKLAKPLSKSVFRGALGSNKKAQIFTGLGAASTTEAATEAVQTGISLTFRPDMTSAEKSRAIVESAIAGGLIGGVIGGGVSTYGSIRSTPEERAEKMLRDAAAAKATDVSDEVVTNLVDSTVAPESEATDTSGAAAPEAAPEAAEASPFANMSEPQLRAELAAAEAVVQAGNASPESVALHEALQTEVRSLVKPERLFADQTTEQIQHRIANLPKKARKFLPQLKAELALRETQQTQPETAAAVKPKPAAKAGGQLNVPPAEARRVAKRDAKQRFVPMRKIALEEGVSTRSNFARNLRAANASELTEAVVEALELKDDTPGVMNLAVRLNIANKDGSDFDFESALRKAEKKDDEAKTAFAEESRKSQPDQEKMGPLADKAEVAGAELKELVASRQRVTNATAVVKARLHPTTEVEPSTGKAKRAEAVTPERRNQLFTEMSDIQRGRPEAAMHKAQLEVGSGVLSHALEHVGDLTFRMGDKFDMLVGSAADVYEKTRSTLASLRSPYGFEKDQAESLAKHAAARGVPTPVAAKSANKALAAYAAAHRKVPVYNELQAAGRDAAIALGERDWAAAITNLEKIERALDEGTYEQQIQEFNPAAGRTDFSRGVVSKTPVAGQGAVAEAVRRVTDTWATDLNIAVVGSVSELPTKIRQEVEAAEAVPGTFIHGWIEKNDIFLIEDKFENTEQAVAVLYHEALGHAGLAKLFTTRLDRMLLSIDKNNEAVRRAADEYQRNWPQAYKSDKNTRARIVEEVLAKRAEDGLIQKSVWKKLVSVVQQFMRRLGWRTFMSDAEVEAILARAHARITNKSQPSKTSGARFMRAHADESPAATATIGTVNTTVKNLSSVADKMWSTMKRRNPKAAGSRWRRMSLPWSTLTHITGLHGRLFKGLNNPVDWLTRYRNGKDEQLATQMRLAQQVIGPVDEYDRLDPKAQDLISELMLETMAGIDPRKTWEEHTWLHKSPLKDNLELRVKAARESHRKLGQLKGVDGKRAVKVYDHFRQVNEMMQHMQHSMLMYNFVRQDAEFRSSILPSGRNPMQEYLRKSTLHQRPAQARDHWQQESDKLINNIVDFINQREASNLFRADEVSDAEITKLGHLKRIVRDVRKVNANTKNQGAYFHLGRFGDYYTAFKLTQAEDREGATQESIDAVVKALTDKGYDGFNIDHDANTRQLYVRVETEAQAQEIFEIATQLQAEGRIDTEEAPLRGRRSDVTPLGTQFEALSQNLISSIQNSNIFTDAQDADKAQLISSIQRTLMDALPDNSIHKLLTHRKNVHGATKDMVRAYAHGGQVTAGAIAKLTGQITSLEALTEMRSMAQEAQSAQSQDVFAMQDVISELATREAREPTEQHKWIDTIRAINHSYFLGMSPAYALTNLTQVGVLLLPELGRKYSYGKAAKSIYKVTPNVLSIVKELIKRRDIDAGITDDVLDSVPGLDAATKEFIMLMVNSGKIDIGSQSRELGRVVNASKKVDLPLRIASALGLYTEVTTRLTAALSARELHEAKHGTADKDARDMYAMRVVDEAMLNYTTGNVARRTGRDGIAGPVTPIAASFMNYTFQLIEKLYREIHGSFTKYEPDAQKRKEAHRFIVGHLTAVTLLSGTLGLPTAALFARVIEEIVDLADDDEEPYDAVNAYRGFLADVFGKEVAEVIARGVPRAMNFDMSIRAGEQAIIPFTRMLTDKREWDVVMKETAFRTAGSPLSMFTNVFAGSTQMMRGDVLEGMKKAVPIALRGPLEAYKMTKHGYTDRAGNVLPMPVGAHDILAKILGFAPSEQAEYREANFSEKQREGQLRQRASLIRNKLSVAIERGDREAARKWFAEAQTFDASNPAYGVLKGLGRTLKTRAKNAAIGRVTGTTIGANLLDGSIPRQEAYNFNR